MVHYVRHWPPCVGACLTAGLLWSVWLFHACSSSSHKGWKLNSLKIKHAETVMWQEGKFVAQPQPERQGKEWRERGKGTGTGATGVSVREQITRAAETARPECLASLQVRFGGPHCAWDT